MSYSGYKGKVRIVHAFSAGGVVFRRMRLTEQTPIVGQDGASAHAAEKQPDAQTASNATCAPADKQSNPPNQPDEAADGASDLTKQADAGVIEVALVGHPRDNNWTLPKGTPHQGETQEQTAIREVGEETGLTVRILKEIGSIHYWFSRRGVRYKKEVLHYLMEATGGDLALHDHEYDEARWFPLDEATQRLAHENEIEIVRRAEELIQQMDADPSPC